MDDDSFWAIVATSRVGLDLSDPEAAAEAQVGALRERLAALSDQELLLFQARLHEQTAQANDWRIWAAGYLAAGGMSDDAFDYFRLWLVMQGRAAFERVLGDPDQLADLRWDADGAAFEVGESLGYLVAETLEGRGIEPGDPVLSATATGEPAGKPFDEDDDTWFAGTFPRLFSRVEEHARRVTRDDRITDAYVGRFVATAHTAKEPRPVEPMAPLLAAELFELGWLRHQDRPMLAAYWIAEGREGEALLELASLRGHEPEVSELWPLALNELGIMLPVTRPRVAMAWAAQRVLAGERDLRWLIRLLWPSVDELGTDPEFDTLIYTLDDRLDWTNRALTRRDENERARATTARQSMDVAIEAMARGDIDGAVRVLEERDG